MTFQEFESLLNNTDNKEITHAQISYSNRATKALNIIPQVQQKLKGF